MVGVITRTSSGGGALQALPMSCFACVLRVFVVGKRVGKKCNRTFECRLNFHGSVRGVLEGSV